MQRRMLYMRKTPLSSAASLYLLAAGLVLFPTEWLGNLFTENEALAQSIGLGLFRLIAASIFWILAFHTGIRNGMAQRGKWKVLLISLPALVVAINNLPIVGIASGTVKITGSVFVVAAFLLQCIGVGIFEEAAFRGVIFPFVLGRFGTGKKGRLIAVIVTSAAFGLLHLVNLLGGISGAVFLQVGYSFLIGAMLAVCMFCGAGVLFCGFVHAVYNFCGGIAYTAGNASFSAVWSAGEIVLTAVIGVAVAVYFACLLWKSSSDYADQLAVLPAKEKDEQNNMKKDTSLPQTENTDQK